ncbi:MAG: UvrD-helicase domain-containing protein [Fusobacteriaceae bacterium]
MFFKDKDENRKGKIYEDTVYRYIRDYFIENDVIGFRSYDIFHKNFSGKREVDILLLHRKYGVIVIEVKGLHIKNIREITGNDWIYHDFYQESGNPYKQGEKQIRLLMEKLEKTDSDLAKKLGQRVIVALPLITNEEWERHEFHNRPNSPPIIFKDDLLSSTGKRTIEKSKIVGQKEPLNDEDWKKIQEIFGISVSEKPDVLFDVKKEEKKSEMSLPCRYSGLYYFSDKKEFQEYLDEIRFILSEGKKVFLFSNFKIEEGTFFKEGSSRTDEKLLRELFQLQIFSDETLEKRRKIVAYDGELNGEEIENLKTEKLSKFNWEQFQVVHAPIDSNLMIKAGAGTGKTHVMMDRIMYLIEKGEVKLSDIIMITFTNESTEEMKERLKNKFLGLFQATKNIKYLDYAEDTGKMQISTIHSFFKRILSALSHHLGYGQDLKLKTFKYEKDMVIRECLDQHFQNKKEDVLEFQKLGIPDYEFEKILSNFWGEIEKKALLKEELPEMDWGKVNNQEYKVLNDIIEKIFIESENKLDTLKKAENAYTVDDLIRKISNFLHDDSLLQDLDMRGKIIFIDEFQDTDNTQIKMMAKLEAVLENQLFVVGDIKQSIYRFRGADYTSFEKLEEYLVKKNKRKNILEFSLQKNYRTCDNILKKIDPIFKKWNEIGHLPFKESDRLLPMKKTESYSKFHVKDIFKMQELEENLIKYIKEFQKDVGNCDKGDNKRIAVIVRRNSDAKKAKNSLDKAGIPSILNLDGTFYGSQVVKDLLFLVNLLIYPNEADYLINGLQTPYFGYRISEKDLIVFDGNSQKIVDAIYSQIRKEDVYKYVDLLKTMPFLGVIQKIISENDLRGNLGGEKIEKARYARNLSHLLNIIIGNFSSLNTDIYGLKKWLELKISTDRTENEPLLEKVNDSLIDITTVHRSKGLEYNSVIIPYTGNNFNFERNSFYIDVTEGKQKKIGWFIKRENQVGFESSNFQNLLEKEDKEVISEEARLLYVAMTRPIQNLVILKSQDKWIGNNKKINSWKDFLKGVEV